MMTAVTSNVNMTMRSPPCKNFTPRHRKNVPITRSKSDGLNMLSVSNAATTTQISKHGKPQNLCNHLKQDQRHKTERLSSNTPNTSTKYSPPSSSSCSSCSPRGESSMDLTISPVVSKHSGSAMSRSGRPRSFTAQPKLNGEQRVGDREYDEVNAAGDAGDKRGSSRSCQALKYAVSDLNRLDDFECEKLGSGFFSEVFKVTHRATDQVMVLKMNISSTNRPNMLREVQLMNRMSHPNILKFLGVCVDGGQLHSLTEYMNAGNLEQLLANKTLELPWTTRIQLTLDLASGMEYLHSRRVLHRDLTSKNVLIRLNEDKSYTAVIGDFGLAEKLPDPLDKNVQLSIVGSPYWMAPEVLKGQWFNEKADVFANGIIMCEVTARIEADPDILPRTANFGVDYLAFSEMIEYCPLDFLQTAFRCCQIDYNKRPSFTEICENLKTIQHNLNENQDDVFGSTHRHLNDDNGKMTLRCRSEDNILQANDPYLDGHNTPVAIAHEMSQTDPFYLPSTVNPFASSNQYKSGQKIVASPLDPYSSAYDDLSPSSPKTPPCMPMSNLEYSPHKRNCHSLPASPNLLRKAAEKLHQESLHGRYRPSLSLTGKPVYIPSILKSKSDIIGERLSQKLEIATSLTESAFPFPSRKNVYADLMAESTQKSSSAADRRSAFRKKQYTVDCAPMYSPEPCSYWGNNNADKQPDTVITEEFSHITIASTSGSSTSNASQNSSVESFMSVDEPVSSDSSCSELETIDIWYSTESNDMPKKSKK